MHRLTLVLLAPIVLALTAVAAGTTGAAAPVAKPWTIALSSNRESRDAEIYSMWADGSGVRRLTRSPYFDGLATWSPNGRKIAFYSQRSPRGDVYVMNPDGSATRNLTGNLAHDSLGSWSPDGRRIAFDSDREGGGIYVMNADGSGQRLLVSQSGLDGNPQWAPDGRTILFRTASDGDEEIYTMDADARNPRNLTNHPRRDGEGGFLWSPDGTRIAFTTNRDGNTEIYVMDADGSDPQRLTRSPGAEALVSWSPDSRRIAFQRWPSTPRWGFFVMNADGTHIRKVTWRLPSR
jgi:Tol biopolymer transport system component